MWISLLLLNLYKIIFLLKCIIRGLNIRSFVLYERLYIFFSLSLGNLIIFASFANLSFLCSPLFINYIHLLMIHLKMLTRIWCFNTFCLSSVYWTYFIFLLAISWWNSCVFQYGYAEPSLFISKHIQKISF